MRKEVSIFVFIFLVVALLVSSNLASAKFSFGITGRVVDSVKTTGDNVVATGKTIFDVIKNIFSGQDTSSQTSTTTSSTQSITINSISSTQTFSPSTYSPGSQVNVAISVTPDPNTVNYIVDECLPSGWTAATISGGGKFFSTGCPVGANPNLPYVTWPIVSGGPGLPISSLTYVSTASPSSTGAQTFNGQVTYDAGFTSPISGSTINQAVTTFTVGVTKQGTGSGTITSTSSPTQANQINCGGTCSVPFNSGTTVTLSASPTVGSSFAGWSNGCTGTGNCVLTAAASPIAMFNIQQFTLSTSVVGSGSIAGTGISCGTGTTNDCTETINYGASVVLTATPATGYSFTSWTGCDSTNANQCTVSMSSVKNVQATFTQFAYTLSAPGVTIQQGQSSTQIVTVAKTAGAAQPVTVNVNTANLPSGVTFTSSNNPCTPTSGSCTVSFTYSATALATAGTFSGIGITGSSPGTTDVATSFSMTVTSIPTFAVSVTKTGSTGTGTVTSTSSPTQANQINCGSTCSVSYNQGTSVTLVATADVSSTFTGWNSVCSGTANCVVSVASSPNAVFAIKTFALTTSVVGSGSIAGTGISCGTGTTNDCTENVNYGTSVTLTATPSTGYSFTSWTGCDSTSTNTCTVSMTSVKNVQATFTQFAYTLSAPGVTIQQGQSSTQTITVAKTAGTAQPVTVNVNTANLPAGVTLTSSNNLPCTPTSGSCTVSFTYSATTGAAAGTFSGIGISGSSPGTANVPATFSMTVTSIPTFAVSVSKTGSTGTGTVTSSPSGINCGSTCSASFNQGTSVTLSATADVSSTFAGWNSVCSGTGNCVLTASSSPNAVFAIKTFALSTSVVGSGSISGTGISCGTGTTNDCTENVNYGTSVVLTATPSTGYSFTSWTGCDSAAGNQCTVSMNSIKNVQATFTQFAYTLSVPGVTIQQGQSSTQTITVAKTAGAAQSVTVNVNTANLPTGVTLTSSNNLFCTPSLADNTCQVSFTYSATSGATAGTFSGIGITGSSPGTANVPAGFSMTVNAIPTFTVGVTEEGTGTGTVTSSPSGINCGSTCSASFNQGTSVTLSATADVSSTFTGWSNGCTGTGTCVVTAVASPIATFAIKTFALSTSVVGSGSITSSSPPGIISCGVGTVNDCTENVNYGATVVLTAAPSQGYSFTSWTGCDSAAGNQCTVSMNSVKNVQATFTQFTYTLSAPGVTVQQGSSSTQTVTVAKTAGAAQSVTVNVNTAILPAGVTLTSSNNPPCTPTSGSCTVSFTYSATALATAGTFSGIGITGSSPGTTDVPTIFSMTVNASATKITPVLSIVITPSNSVTSGTSTTTTGNGCPSGLTCTLTRNSVAVSNPDVATLSAGTYSYTYSTPGNIQYNSASTSSTLTVGQGTPGAPTGLSATTISQNQINLAWNPVTGASYYKIYRSTSSGTEVLFLSGLSVTTYSNTGLLPATTYYYKVSAVNSAGAESPLSNEASATTLQSTSESIPASPTNLVGDALSPYAVKLSWQDNSNNEQGFKILRTSNKRNPYVTVATVGANVVTYTNTGLNPATSYYYKVVAYNTAGDSVPSIVDLEKTLSCSSWKRLFGLSCT